MVNARTGEYALLNAIMDGKEGKLQIDYEAGIKNLIKRCVMQ